MLRKLLAAVGVGTVAAATSAAGPPYSPYRDGPANQIYNLVFCDQPGEFKPKPGERPVAWQVTLYAEPVNVAALRTLADDSSLEGRVRYLAYSRLRQLGQTVPAKRLLGVIIEVPLTNGLDVLAAYSEGGVRYLNQSGKLAFYEGVESLQPLVQRLFAAAAPVIERTGPASQPRRPPPTGSSARITFLVSDGLYFGEGPMADLQRDPLAGPVIQRGVELLQASVALALNK